MSKKQKDVHATWAYKDNKPGAVLLLVQSAVIVDKQDWVSFTEAVQGLKQLPSIENINRTANNLVYEVEFVKAPSMIDIKQSTAALNAVMAGFGWDWWRGCRMDGTLAKEARATDDKTEAEAIKSPADLVKRMREEPGKPLSPTVAKRMRDHMLKESVEHMDRGIANGDITYKDAYEAIAMVIRG